MNKLNEYLNKQVFKVLEIVTEEKQIEAYAMNSIGKNRIRELLLNIYEAGRTDEQEESDNPPDPERN
jgi:hypothetical protein